MKTEDDSTDDLNALPEARAALPPVSPNAPFCRRRTEGGFRIRTRGFEAWKHWSHEEHVDSPQPAGGTERDSLEYLKGIVGFVVGLVRTVWSLVKNQ